MKLLRMYFGLAVFIASLTSFAGQGGNGGDVIVCENGNVYLLDYYRANIILNGESLEDKVSDALSQIDGVSKGFAAVLKDYARELLKDINYVQQNPDITIDQLNKETSVVYFEKGTLIDIPDSDHKSIPKGCSVQQVAIHEEPANFLRKRYIIQIDLMKKLSKDHLAGLILHETIYRFASTKLSHSNSIQSRDLNAYLASELIRNESNTQKIKRLEDFDFMTPSENQICLIDYFYERFFVDSSYKNKKYASYVEMKSCQESIVPFGHVDLKLAAKKSIYFNEKIENSFSGYLLKDEIEIEGFVIKTNSESTYTNNALSPRMLEHYFDAKEKKKFLAKVGDLPALENVEVNIDDQLSLKAKLVYFNPEKEIAVDAHAFTVKTPNLRSYGMKDHITCKLKEALSINKVKAFKLNGNYNVQRGKFIDDLCHLIIRKNVRLGDKSSKEQEILLRTYSVYFENNQVKSIIASLHSIMEIGIDKNKSDLENTFIEFNVAGKNVKVLSKKRGKKHFSLVKYQWNFNSKGELSSVMRIKK